MIKISNEHYVRVRPEEYIKDVKCFISVYKTTKKIVSFYCRNKKYYDNDDNYMVEFFHIGQEDTLHTYSFNATEHCGDVFNLVMFDFFKIDTNEVKPKFAVFIWMEN